MTEPLTRLLHDVGDDVLVPPPPAADVLERGRGLRRRRTAVVSAGVSLTVVAVLTGALLVPGGGGDRAVDPVAPSDPTFEGVTFAVGNEVYLDGGDDVAEIDDRAVKSLYYTSVGVLVRHGNNSASDGGGPQRFSLVRSDGTVSPVSVETEENAHGVDPDQPYLSWTEVAPGGVEVVVHDVDTDTEVARVPVEGDFDWSPPPVALDGDTVYVGGRSGRDPALLAVDWRTGEVQESRVRSYFPEVASGRTVVYGDSQVRLVDVDDGTTVFEVPGGASDAQLTVSPDGRLVRQTVLDVDTFAETSTIVDPATGREIVMPAGNGGWSLDGQPFVLDRGRLTVCSTSTGDCRARGVALGERGPDVRYGGVIYES